MALEDWDLNIWNRLAYESSYTDSGKWEIHVYRNIAECGTPERIIELNETQVEMLGLNDEEDDWWSDPVSFLRQHVNVPRKVRRILENLEVVV
jgi:hypothetical protein